MNVYRILIGLSVLVALTGCERPGTDDANADNDMAPVSDTPQFVEFATFVKTEIKTTPATAEATAINDILFEFNNRDNPNAFDELFTD